VSQQLVERSSLRLIHRIEVVHGGRNEPWTHFEASLVPPSWPHWRLRVKGANVVLAADDAHWDNRPAQTHVLVSLAVPELVELVANRTQDVVLPRGLVTVPTVVTATFTPVPVALEVELVARDGSPSLAQTVEARAVQNSTVLESEPLVAPAGSNLYRSAARTWLPDRQPYRIVVNTVQRGFASLDYTRRITRVRIIDA
jgi:hypothetical protein